MTDSSKRPDLSPSPIFEAVYGAMLTLEFEGLQGRFTSTLAGVTGKGELMVRIPRPVTIRHPLHRGDTVVARYAHEGTVYGFRTRVLAHALRPFPVMILARPSDIGTMLLRRAERVPCLIPATVVKGTRALTGMILDLGRGGCRFACEPAYGESLEFEMGASVELRFPLFRMDERETMRATVRSLSVEEGAVRIGVEFAAPAPEAVARIEAYITSVIDFLEEQAA
jgi:c-di-GMP-binding flagellar brake protein YcgR